ncbi:MAG: FAD-dependent oxidoreductase [Magnetococcales bacterium]|nr:FAD-dependent oxidoreductase [Magnetococcales bacterium]
MRVTIIGSGFAAMAALRRLLDKPGTDSLELTLIAPNDHFTYMPSLIWIPSGLRKGDDLRSPLSRFFDRWNIRHVKSSVTEISDGGRTVLTEEGSVENDALLIASGGRYMAKAPGIEHTLNPCSGIDAAEKVRDRIREMNGGVVAMGFAGNPKEPAAVRGGPLFEFLFGLHTQLQRERRRDRFELHFFTPMPQPGKRLGPTAVKGLLAAMKARNITTHLGSKIKQFEPGRITTEAESFKSDLTLFLPGMTGHPWYQKTGLPLSPGGFIQADAHAKVADVERVYVAGDAGSFPGPDWKAKQAHMAELQANTAADNLYRELIHNKSPNKTFRTELVCIVDTLENGMLVSRFPRLNIMLPPLRLMHWVKRMLEKKTTRRLR